MTYIEWQDELASYLGNISESERKKVHEYYAEMYADKRDSGLSEKQIINEFGAPYDVSFYYCTVYKTGKGRYERNKTFTLNREENEL